MVHSMFQLSAGFLILLLQLPTLGIAAEIENGRFHDRTRDRDVAYKAYWPNVVDRPVPVVIFSHGLGGTRDAAAYLGRALADAGYVSIHIQHPGSDHNAAGQFRSRREARENLRQSLRNRKNLVNRLQDIPFVLDEVTRRNRSGPWSGRFDLSRIGMAGHSYGARSTMFAAGETVGRAGRSVKERRIKAGVVLSPNLPDRQFDPANSYGEIDIPLLHITGTLDADPIRGGRSASRRTKPYELIPAGKQYLLVFGVASCIATNQNNSPLLFMNIHSCPGRRRKCGSARRDPQYSRPPIFTTPNIHVPGAKTAIIPNAGHSMFRQQPKHFCDAVLPFLA